MAALVVCTGVVLMGRQVIEKVEHVNALWQKDTTQARAAIRHLHDVTFHLGFGAFIHHYKNFILRKDLWYAERAAEDLASVRKAIGEYRKLELSGEERNALVNLDVVILDYEERLLQARTLVAAGLESQAIDREVKVNDGPALEAMNLLVEISPGLPVIFCTGYNPEQIDMTTLDAAKVRFLQKPYSSKEVLRTIRELLDGNA